MGGSEALDSAVLGSAAPGAAGLASAVLASGISGFDRSTVGLSGDASATRGRVLSGLITTVTLSRERWRAPSGAMDCRTIWWEPGGRGGGMMAKRTDASATAPAWT